MTTLDWALLAILLAGAVVVFLSWTAGRLDRLHIRLATARASLDRHLVDRAACARGVAASGLLDPASALMTAEAADTARDALGLATQADAESGLSAVLRTVVGDRDEVAALTERADDGQRALLADLGDACERVRLAHRFHEDLVERTRTMRRRRLVRWGHLAGHAPWPVGLAFDDEPPAGVTAR